jgi:hypothetical protein
MQEQRTTPANSPNFRLPEALSSPVPSCSGATSSSIHLGYHVPTSQSILSFDTFAGSSFPDPSRRGRTAGDHEVSSDPLFIKTEAIHGENFSAEEQGDDIMAIDLSDLVCSSGSDISLNQSTSSGRCSQGQPPRGFNKYGRGGKRSCTRCRSRRKKVLQTVYAVY